MSIQEELDYTEYHPGEILELRMALIDFYHLQAYMNAHDNVKDLLKVLRLELEQRARPSFIKRIYSRYVRAKKPIDLANIDTWRTLYERKKSREASKARDKAPRRIDQKVDLSGGEGST